MYKVPEISKEMLESTSQVIKPADLGLVEGDKHRFRIASGHKTNAAGLMSIKVAEKVGEKDHFGLNKTNFRTLAKALGQTNSDDWIGASFDALVVTVNNPQTKSQVLSWKILENTIKPKK